MLSLETLMREAGVTAGPRNRVEAVLGEIGTDTLKRTIDLLPERQRLVLALRYYEALQLQEIAAILGTKERQVEEVLEKAVQALCKKLERVATRKNSRQVGAGEGAGT